MGQPRNPQTSDTQRPGETSESVPIPDLGGIARALDAGVNRATEALRVMEDITRYALNDGHLSRLCKDLRHQIIQHLSPHMALLGIKVRDTLLDCGTEIEAADEYQRVHLRDILARNSRRCQQALRSLEELLKMTQPAAARALEQLRYQSYTLSKAVELLAHNREVLRDVRLCVLVDGERGSDYLRAVLHDLTTAGVPMIQLRQKSGTDRERFRMAEILLNWARPRGVMSIINDRADIAAATGADGVHLGQEDLSPGHARRIIGPHGILGVSTHDLAQARRAVLEGADYLGAGPTFASRTKEFTEFPGLPYLREVACEIGLPTFAIGGIDASNLDQVLAAGIHRVAIGSGIIDAADRTQAARGILQRLTRD